MRRSRRRKMSLPSFISGARPGTPGHLDPIWSPQSITVKGNYAHFSSYNVRTRRVVLVPPSMRKLNNSVGQAGEGRRRRRRRRSVPQSGITRRKCWVIHLLPVITPAAGARSREGRCCATPARTAPRHGCEQKTSQGALRGVSAINYKYPVMSRSMLKPMEFAFVIGSRTAANFPLPVTRARPRRCV